MSHGGKREGAGRKPAPPMLKKEDCRLKLPRWLIDHMDAAPESRAVQIERWAAAYGVTPPDDAAA